MKHSTVVLLFILPTLAMAQTREQALQSVKERKGWYAGTGVYYADQQTYWQYDQTPPAVGTPFYDASQGFGHDVSRVLIAVGLERKSLFGTPHLRDGVFVSHYDRYGNYLGAGYDPVYNFVDFDFGLDALISPSGKTYAEWLNDGNNEISSGGLSLGGSVYLRMNWIFVLSPKLRLTVFSAAIGNQFLHIRNKGGGSATSPLLEDFNYANGWNENINALYLSVGTLGLETGALSITPEVRIVSINSASTTLGPARLIGDVSIEDKPSVITFGLKVLKRF